MTHTSTEQPEALHLIIADLLAQHSLATSGRWAKGATTHDTVSEADGREPYHVASFRHANDAAFCDLAHRHVIRLIDEIESQHARILELEAARAGRVALSDAEIELAMAWGDVCEGDHVLGAFTAGVRHVEKLYGITQEKQP